MQDLDIRHLAKSRIKTANRTIFIDFALTCFFILKTVCVFFFPNTHTYTVFCMILLIMVTFYMQDSQPKGVSEGYWGIQINQHYDLWHFCVKIPQVEHKSRGLWDIVMFTVRAYTLISSSAPLALRNTGYANSSSLPHTKTRPFYEWHRMALFLFCSVKKSETRAHA